MTPYSFSKGPTKPLTIAASGGLGDCLLLTPFIRHFRRSGLYDKIVCATSADKVELFDLNPHIDQVIPCRGNELLLWGAPESRGAVFSPYLRITGPDTLGPHLHLAAEPLHHLNQNGKGVVQQLAEYHGITLDSESLEIYTSEADERFADTVTRRWGKRPLLLLNTRSTHRQKQYPLHCWQEVVDGLREHVTILELSAEESPLTGTEVLRPVPHLRASAALFRRMSCVVTIDSFAHHLACAVGVPAVVLFGPTNPDVFGHSANTNLRVSVCPPCADTARRTQCTRSQCLEEIPPSLIIRAALSHCQLRNAW